ncbi:MAG: alpha/beta hydrolase [Deltaproteobacteria bacterium]
MFATSSDGSEIYFEATGQGDTTLVLVHGWMGNVRWWDAQRDPLAARYRVVALDLAGHGKSAPPRMPGSAEAYAADILAVVREIDAPRVVLVGHSMSGAYAALACSDLDRVVGLILVDTLKNLEVLPTIDQANAMLARYRADYRDAVANVLPKFLFAPTSPPAVVERLQREFLTVPGDVAAALVEPLYRMDVREAARRVRVPVRGIGSDLHGDTAQVNRAYFADYAYRALAGCGHYPMLEVPDAFLAALEAELSTLGA